MLALVDFDPDGLAIMSTYKYGSKALAHETESLASPWVEWLGVRSSDIFKLLVQSDRRATPFQVASSMPTLSLRDRNKGIRMLESGPCAEDGGEQEWRRELQVMLMLNHKAEIELLDQGQGGLSEWLKERLGCH